MTSVLAIDLGATSGRSVVYSLENGKVTSSEILRFDTKTITYRGHLCWDIKSIFKHIEQSIEQAKLTYAIQSIGIDTWGVDFAQLDSSGSLITLPVTYRDDRTKDVLSKIARYSTLTDLYYKTGNQLMPINTLFQLIVAKETEPEFYFKTAKIVMLSDYFNYLLSGNLAIERTIASTMQMLNPLTKEWNKEILSIFEISDLLLPDLVDEGNTLGETSDGLKVINICQHDTASAVATIPKLEDKTLYISCGTWSLIGTELDYPILTDKALTYNFTNEIGHSRTTRFLKNCTGLWIVEELRRHYKELGQEFGFDDIRQMIESVTEDVPIIDTDNQLFAEPGQMIDKIKTYLLEQGYLKFESPGQLFKIAYHSLAYKYREVIDQLEEIIDYDFTYLNLIGGGSKSSYFSQLVADITGKTVVTGLDEATSLGNALVQFKALGDIKDMTEAKEIVKQSVDFKYFYSKKEDVRDDTLS
ncbi:rhamnulokinase [Streptococcus fryi]